MSSPTENAVSIRALAKQYDDTVALHGIDLDIQPGAFFGLLGPNGAGKTTTINILSGLCRKSSGSASIFGNDLVTDYRACRRLVGLVPQEFNFDVFVKLRNMLIFQGGYFGIPRPECEARADALLAQFDLTEKAEARMRQLSGGMKRRAIIARAMMHRPKLLILDEPTAGVDVELRRTLWTFLRQLNEEGTTVLLTTHYIEEAEALCDRIGIINHGRMITIDTTRNLIQRLSSERVHITSASPVEPAIESALSNLCPALDNERVELTLSFDRNKVAYHDMLAQVLAAGVEITNIRPAGNQLEQVFVQLTEQANHG